MFVKAPSTLPPLDEELANQTPSFTDRLVFTLEISPARGGRQIVISGHNVVRVDLDLKSSGFTGELTFRIDDDTASQGTERDLLVNLFRTPSLLKIRLGIKPEHLEIAAGPPARPFEIRGLITEKAMLEGAAPHSPGGPLSYRLYQVRFSDPAQALWRQHFPCQLFTRKSLRDVIMASRNRHILIKFVDPTITRIMPMIFLGLDVKNRPSERASFYDFLMWQLDESSRIWIYNYTRHSYEVHKRKLRPLKVAVAADDIHEIFTYYPETPRWKESLLNDYTEAIQNRPVVPSDPLLTRNLVQGVRQDSRLNTPIRSEFNKKYLRMRNDFKLPKPEFVLRYRLFPSVPYGPGAGIHLGPELAAFKAKSVCVPMEARREICRVFRIVIAAESRESDVRPVYDGKVALHCECRVNVWLEAASNPARRVPPYVVPKYPVQIEGKIVSEVGAHTDATYQFYPDPLTSLHFYKVKIPLWRNQIITLPYNPNMGPGHFYFPAYKDERVLASLYYDHALLKRYIDWRPTAQLPLASQGDQLLLGKTPTNRTSLRHTYEYQRPVFAIERVHKRLGVDYELLRMAEGACLLQVGTPRSVPPPGLPSRLASAGGTTAGTTGASVAAGAPPGGGAARPQHPPGGALGLGSSIKPLFCKVLLDKQNGYVLEILDNVGLNRQTVTLDGSTLTLQVVGPAGTSTYVQTADSVTIAAKNVSITGDTVKIASALGTSLDSLASTNVTSMTGIALQTPATITQLAGVGVEVSTLAMAVNAGAQVAITALGGVAVTGIGTGVQVAGSTVSLSGVQTTVNAVSLALLAAETQMGLPGAPVIPVPAPAAVFPGLDPGNLAALAELPLVTAGGVLPGAV